MRAVIMGAILFAVSAPAAAQSAEQNKRFVGHYYLSGVMETGSELLLKPDGTYEWILMYGSMDQTSQGKWSIENGEGNKQYVILKARDKKDAASPVTLSALRPWDEYAESYVQEIAMDARNYAVPLRCKFLSDDGAEPFIDSAMSPPNKAASKQLTSKAKQTALAEDKARADYEVAAGYAMKNSGLGNATNRVARDARLAWRLAYNIAAQARSDARLPAKSRIEPVLPKECSLEMAPIKPSDLDPSKWIRGMIVSVQNAQTDTRYHDVRVRFGYKSGKQIEALTERGGNAWAPRIKDDPFTSVTIMAIEGAVPPSYTFPVPATTDGMAIINLNDDADAPFTEMRLEVAGDALIGFEGRGRYSRN